MIPKIVVNMSPLIHGARAIRRCTAGIVGELLKQDCLEFHLLYIDHRNRRERRLEGIPASAKEHVVRFPQRILETCWRLASWPTMEILAGGSDIFYNNDFFFPPSRRCAVVATIHGMAYKAIPGLLSANTVRALNEGFRFIRKHADYLIAVSETTKRELVRDYGVEEDRVYVVTHGVDPHFRVLRDGTQVRDILLKKYGIERPYILYVGAIGRHKNIMGILRAFRSFAEKLPYDLVLAGPSDTAWDEARLFVSRHLLESRVRFLGHVGDAEGGLVELYNGASVFVFPSFYEGWTSPPLEAMACGVPVITSKCSSLPETVGDAALKVDPHDTGAISSALQQVLAQPDLRSKLVAEGLEHVRLHTWERAARKLVSVFEDVLSRGRWRGRRNEDRT